MQSLTFLLFLGFAWVSTIEARYGDATWYDLSVGLTACGTQHSNSELVGATAFSFWGPGNPNLDPMCQRHARITHPTNGRSVTIRIRDKCAGCKVNDIDLSPAAFQALGEPLSVGRFKVNWDLL